MVIIQVLLLGVSVINPSFVTADTNSLRAKFSSLKIDALFPGDSNYNKFATPFNKRFIYTPAAIVFPDNTLSVSNSIKVAVGESLTVSARSGGHSYTAFGLGGKNGALVIDLSRLKTVSVDKSTGAAMIGTGNRLGDVAISLNSQGGRALPHGTCAYVGIGGHSAFGGFGFTSRQWGLTLDNIIGHEVVLANGSVVQASKTSHPDLFWALRGAGASYGIMTAVHFQTYPAPTQATNFNYKWELDEIAFGNALIRYQVFSNSDLPAPLGVEANLGKGSQSGKLSFALVGAWYAASSQLDAVLGPFLSNMPQPQSKEVKTTDWITSLQGLAGSQALSTSGVDLTSEHDTFYAKSITTPRATSMSNSSIRAFSKYLAQQGLQSDTHWFVQFELYGGKNSAITNVGQDETAFAQRSILWTVQFYASSSNFAPPYPNSGLTFLDQMVATIVNNNPAGWGYGAYANYVDDRLSSSQWKSQYYNTHYQRLTLIKSTYDPKNIFSFPQSITTAQAPTKHKRED